MFKQKQRITQLEKKKLKKKKRKRKKNKEKEVAKKKDEKKKGLKIIKFKMKSALFFIITGCTFFYHHWV